MKPSPEPRGAPTSSVEQEPSAPSPLRRRLLRRFPPPPQRGKIQDAGRRIGAVLAARGVVSRLAIDFLVRRAAPGAPWDVFAVEINLRIGGTTHPFLALEFLTGGELDPETGVLFHMIGAVSQSGKIST